MQQPPLLRYGLPIGIGLLLLVFWIDESVGLFRYIASVENRRPAARPQVKLDYLDPFPRDYEAYFNDHFRWRGRFQSFNARLQSVTNGRSPLPDLVEIGKDGWFFKGGLQMDIYRGKRRFTPVELKEVVTELQARRDSIEVRGGRYYLAVAPLKHHIYPQFLPDHVRPLNTNHAVRQLYAALEGAGVSTIDLYAPLQAYADTASVTDLYYRTDHHWTVRAGLLASETIFSRLVEEGNDPAFTDWYRTRPGQKKDTLGAAISSPYYITESPGKGMTLSQMAGQEVEETFYVLHRRGDWNSLEVERTDITPPSAFPYPESYVRQRTQEDSELPTLFVNRESFGENLVLPLSEGFSNSFWLFDRWKHDLNLGDYDREGGDIYLQLVWEGFLFNLLDDPVDDGKW